jgi:hypothetical protein
MQDQVHPSVWRKMLSKVSGSEGLDADSFVAAAQILVIELAKDPSIRQQARDFIEACGFVTVTPTDRGMTIIDEYHLYFVSRLI